MPRNPRSVSPVASARKNPPKIQSAAIGNSINNSRILSFITRNPKYISIIAFALTFTGVVVGIILLAKVFTKLAGAAGLGLLNRLLGGLFGLMKMVLVLSVSLNFFLKLNSTNAFAEKKTLDESVFFYPVLSVSNLIFPVLEDWFKEYKQK